MRTIYEGAREVRVWLGPPADDSELAFELLHKLRRKISSPKSVAKILNNTRYQNLYLEAVLRLFQRGYCNRVWVLQEVISARKVTVHCGEDSISWPDLTRVQEEVITFNGDALDRATLRNANVTDLWRFFNNHGPRLLQLPKSENDVGLPELYDVLRKHTLKKSTDPRDLIYAVIGLTKARDDKKLQIDYSKSVRQLFTEVSEYIIRTSRKLNVICDNTYCMKNIYMEAPISDNEFPSWVSDWPSKRDQPSFFPRILHAAGETDADAQCDTDNEILRARGFCIDMVEIDQRTAHMENRNDSTGAMKTFCRWHDLVRSEFSNSGRQWDSFSRVIRLEQLEKEYTEQVAEAVALKRYCELLCPANFSKEILRCMPWDKKGYPLYSEVGENIYVRRVSNAIYKRRFFISRTKMLGLGPGSLQTGDLICVLFGCHYPVILRPHIQHYLLLGPAYVDGHMWGWGVEEEERGRFSIQVFEIH